MNCSLIITTYNWPQALELVLMSVMRQSIMPNEIIVADDGSSQETEKLIKEFSKNSRVAIIHSWQKDVGFRLSRSRNLAIAKAKYEYIIVTDGDMVLHKNFVEDHKKCAERGNYLQGSRSLLQPEFSRELLSNKDIKLPFFFSRNIKNRLNTLRWPLLSWLYCNKHNQALSRIRGCNFSLFKSDIVKVNGFNEDFVTWGKEDSEFVQRLYNSGIYRKNLKFSALQYHIYHKEGSSSDENISILNNTIEKNLSWCLNGIDKHIKRNA